jgi:hypothetical protein
MREDVAKGDISWAIAFSSGATGDSTGRRAINPLELICGTSPWIAGCGTIPGLGIAQSVLARP